MSMCNRSTVKLEGRTAVITGAASGIGRAIARLFAAEGAHIAAIDRNKEFLLTLVENLAVSGGDCRSYSADVADSRAAERVVGEILAHRGAIDVLVTSAGVPADGTLPETDEANWDEAFAVNAKGTYLWIRAVLPSMCRSRRGSIVTIASQLALAGGRANAIYCASKGAVISLSRAVALDHASDGVRVNVILPGAIQTPMLEASFERAPNSALAREQSRTRHPMMRFGTPDDVARAALFLASDDSGFTTGAQIAIDGGWLVG